MLWKLVGWSNMFLNPSTLMWMHYYDPLLWIILNESWIMCEKVIYSTWSKVCGRLLVEHLIPKSWALIWSWSPFAARTASTHLARPSTRCWNIAAGTCFHSATRALMKSDTDVGRLGLACVQLSNSSQRCLMGLMSELCAGQSNCFTPISTTYFCMDLGLCTGALSKQERAFPNCCHNGGSTK